MRTGAAAPPAPQIKSVTKRGERSDQRECGGGSFYI